MHHIVLWKWNQAGFRVDYTSEHVNTVADMIKRNLYDFPARIVCVTDVPKGITECETFPLWPDHAKMMNRSGDRLPSCYRRLKLFDNKTQESMGIAEGDRIVSLDLDMIIASDLRPLLGKPQHFVGWAVRGTHHLRVFNGSMWMFGARQKQLMWDNFDPNMTPNRCYAAGYQGSDQSWLSYNFAKDPTAGSWAYPQLVSYPREVVRRPMLSKGTAVVSFHGRRKPWESETQNETPWVKMHWRRGVDQTDQRLLQVVASGGTVKANKVGGQRATAAN